jgi:hypothetical protein
VIRDDAVTDGFVTMHRHVIGHERHVGLELGVRTLSALPWRVAAKRRLNERMLFRQRSA